MADKSGIQWTEATWNPVAGCTRASAGCDHCYAVTMTHRLEAMGQSKYAGLTVLNGRGERHFNGQVRTDEAALEVPLRWKKPRRVFVNSMSDLFHRDVPFDFIDEVFAVMALCPQHTFQILTKRPERAEEYFLHSRDTLGNKTDERVSMEAEDIGGERHQPLRWPLPNVWLGTSCEDQAGADDRIPHLLRCPAAVRFLSLEPLLGPIDIGKACDPSAFDLEEMLGGGPDWVIVGGESGPRARPCNIEWIRDIVRQCKTASVPVFVKQLGASPICSDVDPANPVAEQPKPEHISGCAYDHNKPHESTGSCVPGCPIGNPPRQMHTNNITVNSVDMSLGEAIRAVEDPHWTRGRSRSMSPHMKLQDHKGGDPSEWPEDLRVREYPKARTA